MGGKKKIVISVFAIIIMVIMTTAFLGIRYYTGLISLDDSSSGEVVPKITEDKDGEELKSDKKVTNILLIGADGDSDTNRSDTMMLISIDESTKQIIMTSFLRDMYLTIPDKGEYRLNAAYAYGGASLLINTIEYNFGIDIDSYASVGFSQFENIVNILGGVSVELTDVEIKYLALESNSDLNGNTMYMDGAWALRFARIRKEEMGTDFDRTDRQKRLLSALFTEVKSSSLTELNTLATEVLPEVTTSLSQKDITSMLLSFGSYSKYEIVTSTIPADGAFEYADINGMSVLTIDLEANKKILHDTIYGE